jgi:putative transcriptional regulator
MCVARRRNSKQSLTPGQHSFTGTPVALRFRLAEILRERGVGRREMARRAGVSYPTILAICENRAGVQLGTLEKIAKALGVSALDLLEEK